MGTLLARVQASQRHAPTENKKCNASAAMPCAVFKVAFVHQPPTKLRRSYQQSPASTAMNANCRYLTTAALPDVPAHICTTFSVVWLAAPAIAPEVPAAAPAVRSVACVRVYSACVRSTLARRAAVSLSSSPSLTSLDKASSKGLRPV